jgi:hypothetical protein
MCSTAATGVAVSCCRPQRAGARSTIGVSGSGGLRRGDPRVLRRGAQAAAFVPGHQPRRADPVLHADPADVAFIDPGRGRGPADRLGLAVQLCTLPWLGFRLGTRDVRMVITGVPLGYPLSGTSPRPRWNRPFQARCFSSRPNLISRTGLRPGGDLGALVVDMATSQHGAMPRPGDYGAMSRPVGQRFTRPRIDSSARASSTGPNTRTTVCTCRPTGLKV